MLMLVACITIQTSSSSVERSKRSLKKNPPSYLSEILMMEDGLSEVVPESNSASPESRLGGDLHSKALVENVDVENQAESLEGVNEGEIMVEIVGFDVFVDGVSGHQEVDLGSGEVEDLKGPMREGRQEAGVGVSSEEKDLNGNGNQVTEAVAVSLVAETDATVIREGEIGEDVVSSDHVEVGMDEKLDLIDDREIVFTTSANTENVDMVGADTPLLSEAIAGGGGLQTAPSGATEIVEFDTVLDIEIGSSNVSADLSPMEKDKSFNSGVNFANNSGSVEASESKEPFQNKYHTEAMVSEKNEADPSKSNGTFFEKDPDQGKSDKEIVREPVFDSTHSENLTDDFAPEVDIYDSFDEESYMSLRSSNMSQSNYFSAPEKERHFSVGDLVWGKVRSHPWWPGQIFDPADASDDATKHYKKGSHLVAYFGDQTFAWNDSSLLKPFRPYFSQMNKQSNSQAFRDAVDCALEEVSRRVQRGLSCSCMSQDAYSEIKNQCMRNSAIRQASVQKCDVDNSCKASYFQPVELLLFIRELAPHGAVGADQLDLVLTQAQLSAFCHFKGYRLPPELSESEELLENDTGSPQKDHKHTSFDASESLRERSLSDLMDLEFSVDMESDSFPDDVGISVSFPVSRKRKADHPLGDGSEKRLSTHAARVFTPTSQAPKASFRIGECISRVASKLTAPGSDDSLKLYEPSERPSMVVSAESSSLDEMLSQIHLLACHPVKEHSFPLTTHTFLLGLRNSIALSRRGRKKGSETASGEVAEEFEFHDVNDSYWTDRIVQNFSPDHLHNGDNSAGTTEVAPFVADTGAKPGRRSRKRFMALSLPVASATEPDENATKKKQESSPAELTLNFENSKHVPSEISLNKIFRRFGALMESETEVDHASGRARVIFKRGFDAEVARDSSEKFNLFGPATVSYQVGYSPLISVKIPPIAPPQPVSDKSWMPNAIA